MTRIFHLSLCATVAMLAAVTPMARAQAFDGEVEGLDVEWYTNTEHDEENRADGGGDAIALDAPAPDAPPSNDGEIPPEPIIDPERPTGEGDFVPAPTMDETLHGEGHTMEEIEELQTVTTTEGTVIGEGEALPVMEGTPDPAVTTTITDTDSTTVDMPNTDTETTTTVTGEAEAANDFSVQLEWLMARREEREQEGPRGCKHRDHMRLSGLRGGQAARFRSGCPSV